MATLTQSLMNALERRAADLPADTKRFILKEVLQAYVLDFLYNHSIYRYLNFYGGTCLHILYQLNRLSEDLDIDNSHGVKIASLQHDLENFFSKRLNYKHVTSQYQESKAGIIRITLKFPVLYELGLTLHRGEMLHLKVEISTHEQIAEIQHTPVLFHGRSFVPAHFSLETMMAGKMIACIERSFSAGKSGINFKGRDYYDLLWFMQRKTWPLEEKLAKDGKQPYSVVTAFESLAENVANISKRELSYDLIPLFEEPVFIETWLNSFHTNFHRFLKFYTK